MAKKLRKVVYSIAAAAIVLGSVFAFSAPKALAAAAYDYQLISQSAYPATLAPGATTNVWIEVKNTGTATWQNNVRLGSGSSYGAANQQRDYTSEFANSDWLSPNRPCGMSDGTRAVSGIIPGWHVRFQFNIKAPMNAGNYKAYFTPVADGITWMKDIGIYWQITVAGEGTPETPGEQGTSGSITASLASTNPASSTLIKNQATANLAEFAFSGSGTINSLTFQRIGVSSDETIPQVYLFDGATRLTDAASLSNNQVTFAGLSVSVPKTLKFKADVANEDDVISQTVGIKLIKINGNDVSVAGNLHTIANANLATTAITNVLAGGGEIEPDTDIVVWEATFNPGTRNVVLGRLALRQIGSISSSDINNFRLLVDGTQVAQSMSLDANNYVTFDLASAPKTLTTGDKNIKVLADINNGATRTFRMSLRTVSDVDLVDSQYNVNISAGGAFPIQGDATEISQGTVSVERTADSPSGEVTLNSTDVILARYTITAYGEPVKIESLKAGIIYNGDDSGDNDVELRNGRLIVNGSQVGNTVNLREIGAGGRQFTTNFTVNPGSPAKVEIRGDIFNNLTAPALEGTDTIQAVLMVGDGNGQALHSLETLDVPSAAVLGNELEVSTSVLTLSLATTYGNQNVVVPQTSAYKLAAYTLNNSGSESVNISSLVLSFGDDVDDTFDYDNLYDAYLKIGSTSTSVRSTVGTTNTFSVSYSLASNSSVTIEVYAKIKLNTGIDEDDSMAVTVGVAGTASQSGVTYSANVKKLKGQVITAVEGSITASVDASTPDAALVDDSGTITAAIFNFSAESDSYKIKEIVLSLGGEYTAVSSIAIKSGSSTLASGAPTVDGITFKNLNVPVAANSEVLISVELTMSTIGIGAGKSGDELTVTLESFKAENGQGTSVNGTGTPLTASEMYAYKAVPSIALVNLPTSTLINGTNTIAKFTISTNGTGTIGWAKMMLNLDAIDSDDDDSLTVNDGTTNIELWDGTRKVGLATAGIDSGVLLIETTAEEQVSGSKTYELRAYITGVESGDSVITRIVGGTDIEYSAPAAYGDVDAAATFVWTDRSASGHNMTSSEDWNNDYLVQSIPLSSQSLSKS